MALYAQANGYPGDPNSRDPSAAGFGPAGAMRRPLGPMEAPGRVVTELPALESIFPPVDPQAHGPLGERAIKAPRTFLLGRQQLAAVYQIGQGVIADRYLADMLRWHGLDTELPKVVRQAAHDIGQAHNAALEAASREEALARAREAETAELTALNTGIGFNISQHQAAGQSPDEAVVDAQYEHAELAARQEGVAQGIAFLEEPAGRRQKALRPPEVDLEAAYEKQFLADPDNNQALLAAGISQRRLKKRGIAALDDAIQLVHTATVLDDLSAHGTADDVSLGVGKINALRDIAERYHAGLAATLFTPVLNLVAGRVQELANPAPQQGETAPSPALSGDPDPGPPADPAAPEGPQATDEHERAYREGLDYAQVAAAALQHGAVDPVHLGSILGMTPDRVTTALRRMEDEGLVARQNGFYGLLRHADVSPAVPARHPEAVQNVVAASEAAGERVLTDQEWALLASLPEDGTSSDLHVKVGAIAYGDWPVDYSEEGRDARLEQERHLHEVIGTLAREGLIIVTPEEGVMWGTRAPGVTELMLTQVAQHLPVLSDVEQGLWRAFQEEGHDGVKAMYDEVSRLLDNEPTMASHAHAHKLHDAMDRLRTLGYIGLDDEGYYQVTRLGTAAWAAFTAAHAAELPQPAE